MKDFRCSEQGCKKLLGKIDDEGTLHIESTRIPFSVEVEKGKITCKNKREHFNNIYKIYKFKKVKTS